MRQGIRHALLGAAVVACAGAGLRAETDDAAQRNALQAWVAEHRAEILQELNRFLALPNVSSDHDGLERNATMLVEMLRRRGMDVRLFETPGAPYVFAELPPQAPHPDGEPPTVLFYAHYDGQPVDPARWTSESPFEPELRGEADDPEARLYARSASDDKAAIVALVRAIDALRATGIPPNVRAKFIFDPEEEIGSPNLAAVLAAAGEALRADLFVVCDGPRHQSGRPTVVFGSRGIVTLSLTVFGADRDLHSGHYGNWAPNPALELARLLESMKDAAGNVTIAGFYDDVAFLSPIERRAIAETPAVESMLQRELGVARPEGRGESLSARINLPSLNIRGLASGWVGGQARTIVPSTATAEIDIRLVKGMRPEAQALRVKAHARAQGFHVVTEPPDAALRRERAKILHLRSGAAVPATRTPMDIPESRALIAAVTRAHAEQPVLMPTIGGTVPMSQFERALGIPVYIVPIVNFDNNQHSPDENLRLGNLWDGIVTYASLLRLPSPRSAERSE